MADRKAELERKKAKLMAIREEKERRRKEKEQKDSEDSPIRTNIDLDNQQELDKVLMSMGLDSVNNVVTNRSNLSSLTPDHSNSNTPDSSLVITSTPASNFSKKRNVSLTVVSVQSTNIPPREMVTYTKQTQTAHGGHERDGSSSSSSPLKGYYEDWWRPRKGGCSFNSSFRNVL
uniref:Cytoplasmic dynein 1 intermediate chain n=1 Tax=Timema tahoe TaxID=61484 RepID=A0A7R9IDA8_9NEOP|nr:unnamed protein product [Timema tahoe]